MIDSQQILRNEHICRDFVNTVMQASKIIDGEIRIPATVCLDLYNKYKDTPSMVQEALLAAHRHIIDFIIRNPGIPIGNIYIYGNFNSEKKPVGPEYYNSLICKS